MATNLAHVFDRMGRTLRAIALFDEEIANLREQFYVTLRAYLARIEAASPPASSALLRVRELLAPGRRQRWSDCYEVEQLLVHLFDAPTLSTELRARLLEAETNLTGRQYDYYDKGARSAAEDAEAQRTLLARLVNDLQWRYTVEEGKRRFAKSLTTRTGAIFLLVLGVFATLVSVACARHWAFEVGDLRLLAAAAVAGSWGASFSMLTSVSDRIAKSKIYELNSSRAWTLLVARALVGAGAACVLFLFFCAGILSGKAFPDMADTAPGKLLEPSTVALLVIWCFIAGFSEKLVPSLLAKTEAGVEHRKSSGEPPRYRPSEPAARPMDALTSGTPAAAE
jgi:hypothetical protein